MHYYAPTGRNEALALLAAGPLRVLAGGTDYFPGLRDGPATEDILDISRISGLRGIVESDGEWRFGAATTWTDISRASLPSCFDGLRAAAREVGSVQIQNAGTIAGNLCNASPAADGVPPLLSLGARVELSALSGKRVVPLSGFIKGVRRTDLKPGEMVTAILVPKQSGVSAFLKLGARRYLVISIAMVAVVIEADAAGRVESARVAVGSCSPVACRLPALEAALTGLPLQPGPLAGAVRAEHLSCLSPIDDVRADAAYRLDAVEELVRRALCAAVAHTCEMVA